MKNLKLLFVAFFAITLFYACSDEDDSKSELEQKVEISDVRFDPNGGGEDGDGNGTSNGAGGCDLSECIGNWLPNNYATFSIGNNPETCELCVKTWMPEGVEGELCVDLVNVANLDVGGFEDDISFSGSVINEQVICYQMDFGASFFATVTLITADGCQSYNFDYINADCDDCCEDEEAEISFTEIGTDINYQILCGKIFVVLDSDCPGPYTWEYSGEPGTGLKGSGSGNGTYFNIDAQNDCGLLGPGNYTVTFTDGQCAETTATYYFEPCNTELYDPANPAVLQMDDVRVRCMSYGIRVTSTTVAKCCSCTGSDVTIRITNGDGEVTEFEGGVTMEAGCQPAESYFKKIFDYDASQWTEQDNLFEIIDCEGNVVYSEEMDDPCD